MLRRAWGAYYAIWSSAVFLLLLIGGYATVRPSTPGTRETELAAFLVVAVVAGMVTLRYFREVWQQTHFPLWKVGRGFLASFALFLVGLTVATGIGGAAGLLAMGPVFVVVAVILAFQLRWSLGYVPLDGALAVAALLVGAVGSSLALLGTGSLLAYGFFWLITVLVWGACAVAAYVRSDPMPPTTSPLRAT